LRLFVNFEESDTARLEFYKLREEKEVRLPLTWLQRMEVTNGFNLLAFQTRSGHFPRVTIEQAILAFENFRELAAGDSFALNQPLEITELEARFVTLSERHTSKHGFRTYDVLNVSAALLIGCDTFLSFDRKATKLAALEGLKVLKLP
jgi:predicted nucleic acid-binding protein